MVWRPASRLPDAPQAGKVRRLPWLCALALLVGCSPPVAKVREVRGEPFEPAQLLQSDSNRFANLTMRDNLASLELLLEKLYRRNPSMWRRSGQTALAPARDAVMQAIRNRAWLDPAQPVRSVAAIRLALAPDFEGDRAGMLIYGLGSMLVEAYQGKVTVSLIDGLDAQRLANAAHNVMVAAWLLADRREADGRPMLFSNELSAHGRNLSFEREIGKIIGRLDTLAATLDEKYRRTVIGYAQGLAAGPFIQFIPLDAATAAAQ